MNWSYIAGFFDGEGCLTTKCDGTISFEARMTQTNLQVLSLISSFLKSNGIQTAIYDRKKYICFGRKQQWTLYIGRRESVLKFLLGVQPFVIVKHVYVQDASRFLRMYPAINGILATERGRAYKKGWRIRHSDEQKGGAP